MSKKTLKKNIGSMSTAVLISRISGLLRDQVFAYFFGVSFVADAFNFAYTIPNLLRRLFGEGALGAAFIPIYQEIGIKKDKKAQIDFAINILSLLTLFLSVLSLLGIIFSPAIIEFLTRILPQFLKNIFHISGNLNNGFPPQTLNLTVKLVRLLFPYLFFIGISSTLISILNSHNYYFLPGLTSAFLNFAMIGSMLVAFFIPSIQSTQLSILLSIGVLVGGILQVVLNFPMLKRIGYGFKFNFSFKGKALGELWNKFLPGVWGIAVRQVNLLADRTLASMLITGSISALNYGNRIMQLPLGIFGVSVGTAVIPHFSRNAASGNWKEFNEKLEYAVSLLAFIMIPVTFLIILLGRDYIHILFMRGAFDKKALAMSYNALVFYSLGLIFYSLNRVYTAIFYSMKNTKTPFIIASVTVGINISLNLILMNIMSYKGLALATSISSAIQLIIILAILNIKYKQILLSNVIFEILKIAVASTIMFFLILFTVKRFSAFGFGASLVRTLGFSFGGIAIYFIILIFFKSNTAVSFYKKLKR